MKNDSINEKPSNQAVVVLLHGIGRSNKSMRTLERVLAFDGYQLLNIDYPSRTKDMLSLAKDVYQQIHPVCNQSDITLHFVTHSMGGIVLRELLAFYQINNLGRIVMLAPPNHGSEVADFLKNNWFFKFFYGPAGIQLTTENAKKYPPLPNHCETGIIAGNKALDLISYFILPGKNDGKVTIENTKLANMKDHIVIEANHTFIMDNKNVIVQVQTFLKEGKFNHLK